MTATEFAYSMYRFRSYSWDKVSAGISMPKVLESDRAILEEEAKNVLSKLRTLSLDGAEKEMEKIWVSNPVPNTDSFGCLFNHTDYLMDEYDKLAEKELAKFKPATKTVDI